MLPNVKVQGRRLSPVWPTPAITIGYLVYQLSTNEVGACRWGCLIGCGYTAYGIAVESFDGEDTVVAGNTLSICFWGRWRSFDALVAGALPEQQCRAWRMRRGTSIALWAME